MANDIAVLVGPHGVGKTTLGRSLPAERFEFFQEIASTIVGRTSAPTASLAFDREVMRRELERDRQLVAATRTPVVETWHVGNIAYARVRGHIELADEYERAFAALLSGLHVTVVRFRMSDDTYSRRMSAMGIDGADRLEFRRDVERCVDDLLERVPGHTVARPELVVDDRTATELVDELEAMLRLLTDRAGGRSDPEPPT